MNHFITSDYHFGHANIIKYCNRPFRDVEHMNEELIRRWNERVKPEDFVYHLGDWCFKNSNEERGEGLTTKAQYYIDQLYGNKIFIAGNHDRNNSLKTLIKSAIIEFGGEKYFLNHFPENVDFRYPINFVGHVHGNWTFKRYKSTILINVSCDAWNFYPKTIEETLAKLKHYQKNNKLEEYIPYQGERK
jgi:calcineurin-like phosphoesterase family protein